jgi:sterol desaturase/sphingolipid hydroxylase (fatty acid hydroxylase superfamily)
MGFAAPIIGYIMKQLLEQRIGQLRYDYENISWFETAIMAISFLMLSDVTFYTTHRFWHTPFMYKISHSTHHSCRPTTTYAAAAADAFEVLLTGFGSVFVPAMLLPMSARLFLVMDLFQHLWSIWLHNHDAHHVHAWM